MPDNYHTVSVDYNRLNKAELPDAFRDIRNLRAVVLFSIASIRRELRKVSIFDFNFLPSRVS